MEHGQPHLRRHRALRRARHPAGLVRRAHEPAAAAPLGHPGGRPARHPRLRGELRLAGHLPGLRRLLGRRARDDPRRLPAGVPAGGRQHAQRRPGPGRGGAGPGSRAPRDVLEGHRRPGPAGHPRRRRPGRPGLPGRVRRLRDPGLPHADDGGVHRVHRRLQHRGRLRLLGHPGRARSDPAPAGRGRHEARGAAPASGRAPRRAAAPAPRARHPSRAGRCRRRGRAGAGRPGGRHHLADGRGRHLDRAQRVHLGRHAHHVRLRGRRRPGGHRRRAAHRAAVGALPGPAHPAARAHFHADPGRARHRDRAERDLRDRALPRRALVPDDATAHRRLRRHVLPHGGGLGAGRRRPGPGRPRGGRATRSASAGARSSGV